MGVEFKPISCVLAVSLGVFGSFGCDEEVMDELSADMTVEEGDGQADVGISDKDVGISNEQIEAYEEHISLLEETLSMLPEDADPELRESLELQVLQTEMALMGPGFSDEFGDVVSATHALTDGNGCSSPQWASMLLTATLLTNPSTFDSVCQYHDRCYTSGAGTYGISRKTCDDSWRPMMEKKCNKMYPEPWRWIIPPMTVLWGNCNITARVMYEAVRSHGASHFKSTPCIGGQTWPKNANEAGPGCSSYEPYDSRRTRVCNGVSSGMRADGSIGRNWSGCRGSGCSACDDALRDYPNYFKNHPLCSKNTTCNGRFYTCGSACPPPTSADR